MRRHRQLPRGQRRTSPSGPKLAASAASVTVRIGGLRQERHSGDDAEQKSGHRAERRRPMPLKHRLGRDILEGQIDDAAGGEQHDAAEQARRRGQEGVAEIGRERA